MIKRYNFLHLYSFFPPLPSGSNTFRLSNTLLTLQLILIVCNIFLTSIKKLSLIDVNCKL